MRRAIRIILFVAAAVAVYLGLVLGAVIAAGEVSCYEVCSPTTEFLDDAAPWPVITAVVISLALAAIVTKPWRS